MDALAFGVSTQSPYICNLNKRHQQSINTLFDCSNPFKSYYFLDNTKHFRFNLQTNNSQTPVDGRSYRFPSVVSDGSNGINSTQVEILDDEDDDEDFAAEEYEEVESSYESFDGEYDDYSSDNEVSYTETDDFGDIQVRPSDIREEKWERVQKLCAKVQENSSYNITARDLASLYEFPIDKFQRQVKCLELSYRLKHCVSQRTRTSPNIINLSRDTRYSVNLRLLEN
eukprot:Gb_30073 [translate_table: standard]